MSRGSGANRRRTSLLAGTRAQKGPNTRASPQLSCIRVIIARELLGMLMAQLYEKARTRALSILHGSYTGSRTFVKGPTSMYPPVGSRSAHSLLTEEGDVHLRPEGGRREAGSPAIAAKMLGSPEEATIKMPR